jgi:hypothetical protein
MHPSFQIPIKKSVTATLFFYLFMLFALAQAQTEKIDGTTGAPLGGIGSGGMKFCAHTGKFFLTWMTPCALQNFSLLESTQLQLYTKRGANVVTSEKLTSVVTGGRSDDDAAYPVHSANFGTVNNVALALTAFSPVDLANVQLMCYPYAFFQISATNTGADPVDIAVAFQAVTWEIPVYVAGRGMKNDAGDFKQALYGTSDDPAAVISVGSDNGFLTSGVCNNTPTAKINRVVVKVTLEANQTKALKFVFTWHNTANGKEGLPRFYYLKDFTTASAVADTGLSHFDQFRDNALAIVTRVRASSLPGWIKNQALVTLHNLTNNTMYTKDERLAFTEGQWATNGTMDQMWHSRQIFIQTVPSLIWQEMKYWASTQMTNPAGQIHHDLGEHYDMSYMCPWNDQQHSDYRDVVKWVDLNCAFIISLYELFIATDDQTQLDYFWPYIKKAGQRILDMVRDYGSTQFPYTFDGSENSYDAGGDPNPYNASIAAATWKILSALADIQGDASLKQTYDQAYTTAKENLKKRYMTATTVYPWNRISEALATGPCLSYFLKMGDLVDTAAVNFMLKKLDQFYTPLSGLGYNSGTYNEWAPYIIGHYAGLELAIGKYPEWKAMQFDWYERIFLNRDRVFNQELGIPTKVSAPKYLATDSSGYINYLSIPVVWRNYYMIVGFHRNKHTGELWLEPMLPPEVNHTMTNALVFTPETWATVSCTEEGAQFQTQKITFTPDKSMDVKGIYLRDKGTANVYVMVNGEQLDAAKITRIGTGGYQREVKVDWQGTVTSTGLNVIVSGDPIGVIYGKSGARLSAPVFTNSNSTFSIATGAAGKHEILVYSMNGTLLKRMSGAGVAAYRFGSALSGCFNVKRGVYLVRVFSGNTVFTRQMIIAN